MLGTELKELEKNLVKLEKQIYDDNYTDDDVRDTLREMGWSIDNLKQLTERIRTKLE